MLITGYARRPGSIHEASIYENSGWKMSYLSLIYLHKHS